MKRPHQFSPPWVDFYDRACPWFAKQLLSFPHFPKLPKELQLLIWKFAVEAEEYQAVSITTKTVYFPQASSHQEVKYKLPSGTLHACFDAREAALKRWNLSLKGELSVSPIYFDFEKDCISFGDFEALEAVSASCENPETPTPDADRVKTVILHVSSLTYLDDISDCCVTFPKLRMLLIAEPDRGPNHIATAHLRQTQTYDQHREEFPAMSRHFHGLRSMVKRDMKSRGESFKGWEQPLVIWGTHEQWIRLCGKSERKQLSRSKSLNLDAMEWQRECVFPMLEFEDGRPANDFQSLAFAERRKKRLLQMPSWYERKGILRKGIGQHD